MPDFIYRNIPLFVFVVLIFITGVIFGAVAVRTVEYNMKQDLFNVFNNFVGELEGIEYESKEIISDSIRFNLFNIIIIWVVGATLILVFIIPLLLFFRGFVLGFTVGFLISQYSLKGIIISLLTVFLQNIIIIPAYITAGVIGLSFAFKIFKYYRGRLKLNFSDFTVYSLQLLVVMMFLFVGSLIESYLIPGLFKLMASYLHL